MYSLQFDSGRSSTARQKFVSQSRFGSLDGLRALSILAVIWHHTAPTSVGESLAHFGTRGVTLFFAISGFLITTLLLRERDRKGRIDLRAFYVRRSLRILPLYFGVLLIYIAVVWALERHTEAGENFFINLKYFATYTSNLFVPLEDRTIFYFAWSLASEEQYYLIWPPILVWMGTLRRAVPSLALLAAACLIASCTESKALSLIPLAMVAGTLLALTFHTDRGFKIAYFCFGNAWTPFALAVALGITLICLTKFDVLTEVLCAALVGACVIREDHVLSRLLSLRALTYIGSISYGMYMLHMLCKSVSVKLLTIGNLPTDSVLVFVLTACLAVVAATVSFYTYEAYFMSFKHRTDKRLANAACDANASFQGSALERSPLEALPR